MVLRSFCKSLLINFCMSQTVSFSIQLASVLFLKLSVITQGIAFVINNWWRLWCRWMDYDADADARAAAAFSAANHRQINQTSARYR